MTVTLDSLEQSHRSLIRRRARLLPPARWTIGILVGGAIAPFWAASVLFTPLLGLLLVLLSLAATLRYVAISGSWAALGGGGVGAISSLAMVTALLTSYLAKADAIVYFICALAVAADLVYLVGIAGLIWYRFERASEDRRPPPLHLTADSSFSSPT
jgi:hypothetical protein